MTTSPEVLEAVLQQLTQQLLQPHDLREEDADSDGQLVTGSYGATDLLRGDLRQVQWAQGDVES